MAKDLKKVFLGVALILLAVGALGLGAFYQFVVKPELAQRKAAPAPKEIEIRRTMTPAPSPSEPAANPDAIDMNRLLAESKAVHGEAAAKAKEGLLWVDRSSSRYVVTLGALQGLSSGKVLGVYDKDKKLGTVTAETVFDVISYVKPSGNLSDQLQNDYYNVVIE